MIRFPALFTSSRSNIENRSSNGTRNSSISSSRAPNLPRIGNDPLHCAKGVGAVPCRRDARDARDD
jgi:hypothetical protein